jgi:hypothetical protein
MEDVRKKEGLALEELEAQRVELLPDREEMHHRHIDLFSHNAAIAVQGSTANAGNVFVIAVEG